MKIQTILHPSAVLDRIEGTTKPEILKALCAPVARLLPALDEDTLLQTLLDRERLGSTGLADGIAIPHGKLRALDRIVASFGRRPEGVDFEALDKRPTRLFFAIFAPEAAGGDHLKALARISRLLKNEAFRLEVLGAPSAEAIYRLICAEDDRI